MSRPAIRLFVFAALDELGDASVEQVRKRLERYGFTREQVQACVWKVSNEGQIRAVGQCRDEQDRDASIYRLACKPPAGGFGALEREEFQPKLPTGPQAAYASVFDYGQGRAVHLTWKATAPQEAR